METWDDPAPLSRVWCLDELRNALLLGKEVKICMPQQAMRAFKERAEQDPVATIEAVKRVCGRVSIEHASATHEQDRLYVLDKVASTLNFEFLNEVCREIIRNALLEAAGFARADVEDTEAWTSRWREIFDGRIIAVEATDEAGKKLMTIPQTIEIKRAVAMMQRRIFENESAEYAQGTQLLRDAEQLTRRFYGEKSQLFSDIARQLSS